MADSFQKHFSGMKMFEYWLKFYRILFVNVQLTKFIIASSYGLVANGCQSITWTNDNPAW